VRALFRDFTLIVRCRQWQNHPQFCAHQGRLQFSLQEAYLLEFTLNLQTRVLGALVWDFWALHYWQNHRMAATTSAYHQIIRPGRITRRRYTRLIQKLRRRSPVRHRGLAHRQWKFARRQREAPEESHRHRQVDCHLAQRSQAPVLLKKTCMLLATLLLVRTGVAPSVLVQE